ncbi:hypothetical protein N9N67_00950 [Bacteriovoracaceae bacterium]|nr:hypothetical protein [Bacteriovoracaceae bacterium]
MKVKSVSLMVLCTLFSFSSFAQQKDYYELLQSIESKMDHLNRLITESRRHEKLSLLKLEQLDASLEQAWFSFKRSNHSGPGHHPGNNPGNHNPFPPHNPPPVQPPVAVCPDIAVGSVILTQKSGQSLFMKIDQVSADCYATGIVGNQYTSIDLLSTQSQILMATDTSLGQMAQLIAAQCEGVYVGQRIKMSVNGRRRNVTVTKIAEDCTVEVSYRGQLSIRKLN